MCGINDGLLHLRSLPSTCCDMLLPCPGTQALRDTVAVLTPSKLQELKESLAHMGLSHTPSAHLM
jgi:hypothetical protein